MNTDKQTILDLELFSKDKNKNSIFNIYNRTKTLGGRRKLHEYFQLPVSDIGFLNNRKSEIQVFIYEKVRLKLNRRHIDFIEYYRKNRRTPLRSNWIDAYKEAVSYRIYSDGDYYNIREGIFYLLHFLNDLNTFLDEIDEIAFPASLKGKLSLCKKFLKEKELRRFLVRLPEKSIDIGPSALGRLDTFFRVKQKNTLQNILETVYEVDVLQGLAELVDEENYSLAEYISNEETVFETENCFHPFISKAVKNNYKLGPDSSMCFITGPNMAGKSTFLKTIGLLSYVSHLGFPVPAKKLVISVQNCLFTTINLADSLELGISHFYSEVKRVKEMALKLESKKRMIVIFDELFKGTNVKDAYDATLMVVTALSEIRNSIFFVSSHILEVAEKLSECEKLDFKCFGTVPFYNSVKYDYKLKSGISAERVGFEIVKKEGIIDVLNSVVSSQE